MKKIADRVTIQLPVDPRGQILVGDNANYHARVCADVNRAPADEQQFETLEAGYVVNSPDHA